MAQQLPWVRYDTSTPSHPKILQLVSQGEWRAIAAWHFSFAYVGMHSMAGFVPGNALPFVHARPRDAKKLVEVGLWKMVPGGFEIPNWEEEQYSDARSKRRRENAQKAANARWDKVRAAKYGSLEVIAGAPEIACE